ncbi:GNAT family N-acetyltransferase [Flavobacterium sp.]|uniref:GNAT family N-acetyltransferase n=1 Tax=Flavobacterium sp. TaxID=239 RepID=UPI003752B77B
MHFNIQPTHLQNQLIKLIPLQKSDFEELFSVASDKLIWEQHPNKNRYKKDVFLNYFEGAIQSQGAFFIREATSNEPIGSTRFYEIDLQNNSVKIGYTFIGCKFWGNGYNKALKKLMLDYAFQFVDNVIFEVGANNIRSQKAIEKIGGIKIDEIEVEYYGEDSKLNYIYQINKK